ncbi:hypothetical protein DPMN_148065 [Dreissena polymorpha]|uniref:Uncharacterized protein n=1 Tax=Dreissena polymorpha TaxID=45954 RepID=A0A9D4F927_DREPO|nr:hypothetical protein DPMN_148065 [Dreissena polymorpha]
MSKPNEVARGCLPIRCHHKCDESKIRSPTTRLGIALKDNRIVYILFCQPKQRH